MAKEGLFNILARHIKIGQMTRDGVKTLGLPLFADEKYASNSVTSVAGAGSLNIKKLITIMREEHGIVLGGGQLTLGGKIFRIGHMGFVSEADIQGVLDALKIALPKAGFGG